MLPGLMDIPILVRAIAVLLVLLGWRRDRPALGARLGRSASGVLGTGLLGALDRVAGAVVGAGQAILILWLAGGILATGAIPGLGDVAQASRAIRTIAVALPPPTAIVLELGRALDESGLPDVFLGLDRLPATPVDLPDDPLAQLIGGRAAGSVLRIQAETCDARSSGTGFVVAAGYVVTNAHVIAGAEAISVDTATDRRRRCRLRPELDIALLSVAASPRHPSSSRGELSRGDVGATFAPAARRSSSCGRADTYDAEGLNVALPPASRGGSSSPQLSIRATAATVPRRWTVGGLFAESCRRRRLRARPRPSPWPSCRRSADRRRRYRRSSAEPYHPPMTTDLTAVEGPYGASWEPGASRRLQHRRPSHSRP
jgi:hypothetical protein